MHGWWCHHWFFKSHIDQGKVVLTNIIINNCEFALEQRLRRRRVKRVQGINTWTMFRVNSFLNIPIFLLNLHFFMSQEFRFDQVFTFFSTNIRSSSRASGLIFYFICKQRCGKSCFSFFSRCSIKTTVKKFQAIEETRICWSGAEAFTN